MLFHAALRIRKCHRFAKGATSINQHEYRVLEAIDDDLANSAPGLAWMLATFTLATAGQTMPARETIRAGADDVPPRDSNESAGTPTSHIMRLAMGRWTWRWCSMCRINVRRWMRWVLRPVRLLVALADAAGAVREFRSRSWGVLPLSAWAAHGDAESTIAEGQQAAPVADGRTARLEYEPTEQWPDTVIFDRADCGPARPVVRVIIPSAQHRPYETELLLCGHHYRVSRAALARVHASVCQLPGPSGSKPTALIPDLPRSPVPVI